MVFSCFNKIHGLPSINYTGVSVSSQLDFKHHCTGSKTEHTYIVIKQRSLSLMMSQETHIAKMSIRISNRFEITIILEFTFLFLGLLVLRENAVKSSDYCRNISHNLTYGRQKRNRSTFLIFKVMQKKLHLK